LSANTVVKRPNFDRGTSENNFFLKNEYDKTL